MVAEFLKYRFNHALSSNLYFWRDSANNEIDILVEKADILVAIEIKSGQTIARDFFNNLKKFSSLAGKDLESAALIYGGIQSQTREQVNVLSWQDIHEFCAKIIS